MNSKVFASAISHEKEGLKAIHALSSKVLEGLGGKSCDAALVFLSETYPEDSAEELMRVFRALVSPAVFLACNASGVIGDREEVEMAPAISALAMHLPGVKAVPFSLSSADLDLIADGEAFVKHLDIYPTDKPNFICLGDPSACDVSKLLDLFNQGYSKAPVIGGLGSAGLAEQPGWMCLNDEFLRDGAAGIAFQGDIEFEICVAQGCRPIGEAYAVTKADQNILYELAGKPALEIFRTVYQKLSPEDQQLAQSSLFMGLAIDEFQTDYKRGDFLVRNITGVDQASGALSIGALLEPGQTVQFQLRDARSSDEDLSRLVARMIPPAPQKPEGALLISCCGRGRGLYGVENHDIQRIQSLRGPIPVTGFFANGEFGPLHERNYIHGYTSSLTLIR
ncbi:MAG: hypothetical protein FGM27_08045 [Candidatus Omnitrophica bacterium]|nr:hypothetical protein [Candidatus Omnitrophota bacterium]